MMELDCLSVAPSYFSPTCLSLRVIKSLLLFQGIQPSAISPAYVRPRHINATVDVETMERSPDLGHYEHLNDGFVAGDDEAAQRRHFEEINEVLCAALIRGTPSQLVISWGPFGSQVPCLHRGGVAKLDFKRRHNGMNTDVEALALLKRVDSGLQKVGKHILHRASPGCCLFASSSKASALLKISPICRHHTVLWAAERIA